jgi:hypothetical protein
MPLATAAEQITRLQDQLGLLQDQMAYMQEQLQVLVSTIQTRVEEESKSMQNLLYPLTNRCYRQDHYYNDHNHFDRKKYNAK